MQGTVNTDIKTKVHFFFISNPPLKKLLFQLLVKTLSKRSLASVNLPLVTIKKAKLTIKINTIEMIIARHKFARLKYVIKPNNTPVKENKTAKK